MNEFIVPRRGVEADVERQFLGPLEDTRRGSKIVRPWRVSSHNTFRGSRVFFFFRKRERRWARGLVAGYLSPGRGHGNARDGESGHAAASKVWRVFEWETGDVDKNGDRILESEETGIFQLPSYCRVYRLTKTSTRACRKPPSFSAACPLLLVFGRQ